VPLIRGDLVVVRGAGDLGTGCVIRLVRAGFRVVVLEVASPTAIRRTVSLSESVYDGEAVVEGVRAVRAERVSAAWTPGDLVPVLVDPDGREVGRLGPVALVDAIIAKRNLETHLGMAPVVVALGPGFEAGRDAHAVVETNRGHDLGRVILRGSAEPDTGRPGLVAGEGASRVLHAPAAGPVELFREIGDRVEKGEALLSIGGVPVRSNLAGVVRGLIRPGFEAWTGLKVADVDPSFAKERCSSVSDKARAVAGGVLEAILSLAP
jgi:xanthine dehydrogenase accessory factor